MSAFVVSDFHIRALVSWAILRHGCDAVTYHWSGARRDVRHDASRVASVLYAENVRSVNARYNEAEPAHGFTFKRVDVGHLRPADIVNACRCYAYQACEADGWEASEAFAIVHAIEDAAVRDLCAGSDVWCLEEPARRACA